MGGQFEDTPENRSIDRSGLTVVHVSVFGEYFSTVLKDVTPSYPPQMYTCSSRAATPTALRLHCMARPWVQHFVFGS